jgi:3'-phosphoadenosine 5'-phosphosulfate sulfotransferase (PAPS reductase)/FAD synthetase
MTRHIVPISGKDSLATALVLREQAPWHTYEYVFNDTHADPPEVYVWLDRVERALGKPITRLGVSLEDVIYEQGILPSAMARYCTRMAKIYPMEDWLKGDGDDAILYLGIRADETRGGYRPSSAKIRVTPRYPLQEAGLGVDDVWAKVAEADLLPPTFFWQTLYDEVWQSLDESAALIDRLPRTQFNQLFAWRTRPNCFFCFFQRQYEWVGLLEHHPDLFAKAEEMEREIGGKGYTWIKGKSLADIRRDANHIRRKRARDVTNQILRGAQSTFLEAEEISLEVVSCGLFCGK